MPAIGRDRYFRDIPPQFPDQLRFRSSTEGSIRSTAQDDGQVEEQCLHEVHQTHAANATTIGQPVSWGALQSAPWPSSRRASALLGGSDLL